MLKKTTEVFESDLLNVELEVFADEQNTFWFHGASLCDIFSLKNPTLVIQRHVDEDWRKKFPHEKGRDSWFVQEPGLYQLLHASEHPAAKRFQRWVYGVLLPKLRADGGYVQPTISETQYATLQGDLDKANPQAAWVRDAARIVELENYVESYRKKLAVLDKIACRIEADCPKKEILRYIDEWGKDFMEYHKEAKKALQKALSSALKKYKGYPQLFREASAPIVNSKDVHKMKLSLPWDRDHS